MKLKDKISSLLDNRVIVSITLALALIISASLCASQVLRFIRSRQVLDYSVQNEVSAAAEHPVEEEAPVPVSEPAEELEAIFTSLNVSSSEEDLSINIQNESGERITGQNFILRLLAPGKTRSVTYFSDFEGSCHVTGLPAGEYTVSLSEQNGYASAETVVCEVKAKIVREAVAVTEPVTTVQQAASETKTNTPTSGEITIGDIDSAVETQIAELNSPNSLPAPEPLPTPAPTPVPTEQPEPVVPGISNKIGIGDYNYYISTDASGYIYLADGATVSNVLLIQEDMGGAVYGLRLNAESTESVELIYSGASVNTEFYIIAQPIMAAPVETPVPTPEPTPEPVPTVKVGWQQENGKTYFYNSLGNKITGLNRIDGKLYFFSPDGAKASSLGIDVSYFNGSIDWNSVKNDGIEFAIIRVGGRGWSTGLLYDDTLAYQNLSNAKAAGLKVGVYFYSTAIDVEEAIQEASLAIQNLHGMSLDFPIYFDTEPSGDYPLGRADQLSAEQQTEVAKAFCDTVINSGYTAGVYSGINYYYNNVNFSALSGYKVWLANYTRNYALPSFAGRYDMWQFTDTGRVSGIHGYVDMDVIF